jgi:hypothetical protein
LRASLVTMSAAKQAAGVVRNCYISRPVAANESNATGVLLDVKEVCIRGNEILSAIMAVRNIWKSSPIVWLSNAAYRIEVIHDDAHYTSLWQMALNVDVDPSGQVRYSIRNKRTVIIMYA